MLFVAVAFIPAVSHAQVSQDQGGSTYSNPGSTNTGGNTGMTSTANQTNDTGFNLWWLLPLIALPLLFLAFRQGTRNEETRTYSSQSTMAGAKGGRSKSEDDDYEEAV